MKIIKILCAILLLIPLIIFAVYSIFNPFAAIPVVVLAAFIVCVWKIIKEREKQQIKEAEKAINSEQTANPENLSKPKKVTTPASKYAAEKKLIEKYEPEIDEYNRFLGGVYLCASDATKHVCIHKETKELLAFSAEEVAHGKYCFAKQPEKITSYSQLQDCLDAQAKAFFSDLTASNWEEYFSFMFLPPDHSGETLRKQLLSKERCVVRAAVFTVHDLILKDPKERKAFLADAYEHRELIKRNFSTLDMGGMFVSGNRFNHRAMQVIEGNNTDKCHCRLLIDEYGPSANGLAKNNGFILVKEDEKVSDYMYEGVIECPVCHQHYSIVEEYTGWHIPTVIRCAAITNPAENKTAESAKDTTDYLDDVTFIQEMKHITTGPWHQYDVLLAARGYGWDMMKEWADYMTEVDLEQVSQVTVGEHGVQEKDVTTAHLQHGSKCRNIAELDKEMGMLSVAGMSKTLKSPMKIIWINQTRVLRLFTMEDDELLVKKYVETMIRRTFGTENAMKLGKPIPEKT